MRWCSIAVGACPWLPSRLRVEPSLAAADFRRSHAAQALEVLSVVVKRTSCEQICKGESIRKDAEHLDFRYFCGLAAPPKRRPRSHPRPGLGELAAGIVLSF